LIRSAREVNNYKTEWVIEKIKNASLEFEKKENRKPQIALFGLSFKPNIDDLRESPAIKVAESVQAYLPIWVVEPHIKSHSKFKLIEAEKAYQEADIIVYLVAHRKFKPIPPNTKMILDFCNINA